MLPFIDLAAQRARLQPKLDQAIAKVIDIFTTGVASRSPYRFERSEFDMQALGFGPRGKRGTGLIPSGFRPSDDPCAFPFHVPR